MKTFLVFFLGLLLPLISTHSFASPIITCKTKDFTVYILPLIGSPDEIEIHIEDNKTGDRLATLKAVDKTDPHESNWPVITGNAAVDFSFFAQAHGKPQTLSFAGKEYASEATCSW